MFQHTAARRRLERTVWRPRQRTAVSTHSRPKAAGQCRRLAHKPGAFQHTAARRRLVNDQSQIQGAMQFQHTAARRRLGSQGNALGSSATVSTHSRPKAAGYRFQFNLPNFKFQHTAARRRLVGYKLLTGLGQKVSTHSRPKAAGINIQTTFKGSSVSTHSRPKAAGYLYSRYTITVEFQHTAARRRLEIDLPYTFCEHKFQHTAARRRLDGAKKYLAGM